MAAAIAAHLCGRHLRGEASPQADGRQLVYSAELHRAWESTIRRNPACRFDHERWIVSKAKVDPRRFTLGEALTEWGGPLAVPGVAFTRRLRCGACGDSRDVLALAARLSAGQLLCPACGAETVFGPLDLVHEIDSSAAQTLGAGTLERPLAEIGLLPGDLLRSGRGYVELGGRSSRKGGSR
jgi:hypothetical protein